MLVLYCSECGRRMEVDIAHDHEIQPCPCGCRKLIGQRRTDTPSVPYILTERDRHFLRSFKIVIDN